MNTKRVAVGEATGVAGQQSLGVSGPAGSHLIPRERRPTRRAVLAALLLSLSAPASRARAAEPPPPLIGRWESVVRSMGGLGQVIEFQPDGTMVRWTAALVELTYEVRGPLLLTFSAHPRSGAIETQTSEIRFEGDVMVQTDPKGGGEKRLSRKRAGGPQDPPIVGVWTIRHDTGQTAYLLYTADGRLVFRLPIRADRGRWSVSGDDLTLDLGPSSSTTVRYAVQRDELALTDALGKRRVFARAEVIEYP